MNINRDIFSVVAASDSARISANCDLPLGEVNRWLSEEFQMLLPESLGFDSFVRLTPDSFFANDLCLEDEFCLSFRRDGIPNLVAALAEREGFHIRHGGIGGGTCYLSAAIHRGNVMAIVSAPLGNPCYTPLDKEDEAKDKKRFQEILSNFGNLEDFDSKILPKVPGKLVLWDNFDFKGQTRFMRFQGPFKNFWEVFKVSETDLLAPNFASEIAKAKVQSPQ